MSAGLRRAVAVCCVGAATACAAVAAPKVALGVAASAEVRPRPTSLGYAANTAGGRTVIAPSMPYLERVEAGGPIDPIGFNWQPFQWDFPTLQVTVDNPGDAPLVLKAVLLKVRESVLDPRPIPVIKPDSYGSNARHFFLFNEGWGEMEALEIRFNLLPVAAEGPAATAPSAYRHTLRPGAVGEGINVDVSAALALEGVKLQALPAGRMDRDAPIDTRAFGPFKDGSADVVGELSYQAPQPGGSRQSRAVKFRTRVYLVNEYRAGVPAPPRYDYEARLQTEGRDYVVRVPVSVTVPARGRQLIGVRIGVDKSSRHDLRVQLESANSEDMGDGAAAELSVILPRMGAKYVKGQ